MVAAHLASATEGRAGTKPGRDMQGYWRLCSCTLTKPCVLPAPTLQCLACAHQQLLSVWAYQLLKLASGLTWGHGWSASGAELLASAFAACSSIGGTPAGTGADPKAMGAVHVSGSPPSRSQEKDALRSEPSLWCAACTKWVTIPWAASGRCCSTGKVKLLHAAAAEKQLAALKADVPDQPSVCCGQPG